MLHLTTCFQPVNGRIQLQVLASQNLPASSSPLTHGRSSWNLTHSSHLWLRYVTAAAASLLLPEAFFVKVEMQQSGRAAATKKTRALKASEGQCQWKETFHFLLAALDQDCTLSVKLYSRGSMRRKQCLGQVSPSSYLHTRARFEVSGVLAEECLQVQLGFGSPVPEAVEQWKDTMAHPEKVVAAWHSLSAA